MKIKDIISILEGFAPPVLQESYDNAGLLTGNPNWDCTGIICSLDATEEVVLEAIQKNCNMIVAHHPIVFSGLKKINGKTYVEKTIIAAIKNDIAIYAIHTNLDNILQGVNGKIADMLGLHTTSILAVKENTLKKLYTFVPVAQADNVKTALFAAGAGHIGNYSNCSFATEGLGTFKAGLQSNPFVGNIDERHLEKEVKIEVVFPSYLQSSIIDALKASHPYEEVAYDVVNLGNSHPQIGAGLIGFLKEPMPETAFLAHLKAVFKTPTIKHTPFTGKQICKVALCGGAGSFLISKALAAKADAYITGDLKYHEFFDANASLLLTDVGHYESEQFTIHLLQEKLAEKIPTFAVLKTEVKTNPVQYFS